MDVFVEQTPLPGVLVVRHQMFEDARGFFQEVYRLDEFSKHGLPTQFVQLNHSRSAKGVLRGLHFQWDPPMGKLMRVTQGEAFLVAVDIRKGSPTFGKWFGKTMRAAERQQIWAPAGCARGFCALSESTEIEYLCTGVYNPKGESAVLWNDPEIGIEWPIRAPALSDKDSNAQTLAQWKQRSEFGQFSYP